MKSFDKGLSPSKSSAYRNLPSSGTVENDENDLSDEKTIPLFESHKIAYDKHVMCGASRKKILAEINGNPSASDAHGHKNSNLAIEMSPKKKGISDGVVLKDDSSVKVYDPLTNILSPRPQYLRFNPNRRHEILKRLEKELDKSLDSEEASDKEEWSAEENPDFSLSPPEGSDVNQSNGEMSEEDNGIDLDVYEVEEDGEMEEITCSSLSPPKENAVNERNNGGISKEAHCNIVNGNEVEVEEEEEEEGEENGERGCCLRRILKVLLILVACLLSTPYICSMISPTEQAIWDSKDGGLVVKNETLTFATMQLRDHGFFQVEDGGDNSIEEEVEVDEKNYGESYERIVEAVIIEYLRDEKEMVGNEDEDFEDIVDDTADLEFRADEFEHLIVGETDETMDSDVLLDVEEASYYMSLDEDEDEDNLNMEEAAEMEIIGDGILDFEAQSLDKLIGAKTVESEDASEHMFEMEIDSFDELLRPQLLLDSISEELPTESKGADDMVSWEELAGSDEVDLSDSIHEVDNEMGDDDAQGEMEKSEWNTSTVVGVSAVVVTISTLLAIIYHSKKSMRSTSAKESQRVLVRKIAVEENVNSVPPPSIDRKKVEFLARAPVSSHSTREAPRAFANRINAPIVELIGEIVIGPPTMVVSKENRNATLPQKVHATSQKPAAEPHHPPTVSISSGGFAAERNILKKEGGQSREAVIGTTSVRRSSRLRNRSAVMSP